MENRRYHRQGCLAFGQKEFKTYYQEGETDRGKGEFAIVILVYHSWEALFLCWSYQAAITKYSDTEWLINNRNIFLTTWRLEI